MVQSRGRQNQLLHREVNRRIREISDSFGREGSVQFLCECGREDCRATVELTEADLDGLLGDDHRVVVAAQHRSSVDGARLVVDEQTFLVFAVAD
jgi:hypothetical protein